MQSVKNHQPLSDLYALWKKLGDVPTVEDSSSRQVLDEPFLHFATGTPCEDVWHWFEDQNVDFVVGEVMSGTLRA